MLTHLLHFNFMPSLRKVVCLFIHYFKNLLKKGLFILKERELKNRGGAEREGERERIPCRIFTVSKEPDAGLELMNHEIMT